MVYTTIFNNLIILTTNHWVLSARTEVGENRSISTESATLCCHVSTEAQNGQTLGFHVSCNQNKQTKKKLDCLFAWTDEKGAFGCNLQSYSQMPLNLHHTLNT